LGAAPCGVIKSKGVISHLQVGAPSIAFRAFFHLRKAHRWASDGSSRDGNYKSKNHNACRSKCSMLADSGWFAHQLAHRSAVLSQFPKLEHVPVNSNQIPSSL
jgi:hypothetical protein